MVANSGFTDSRRWVKAGASWVVLVLALAYFIARHWPMMTDAPLFHYIVFLIQNGRVPYRDIADMNMPGVYLTEWLAMRIFGGYDAGWYRFDVFLGIVSLLGGAWVAGRGKRLAGIAGAGLACLFHLADGPWNLGQRDWMVAVLLLLSAGCFLSVVRGGRPALGFCGVLLGCYAASIKPLSLIFPLVLALVTIYQLHRSGRKWLSFAAFSALGIIPVFLSFSYLLFKAHALGAFLTVLRTLVPYYAGLGNPHLARLIVHLMPIGLWALVLLAACLYIKVRAWQTSTVNLLAVSILCSLFLYFAQRKGFVYHHYPFVMFSCIWLMVWIFSFIESAERRTTATTLLFGVAVFLLPVLCAAHVLQTKYSMETSRHIGADLTRLGGDRLSRSVQCIDITRAGCTNALYRMKLLESTGFVQNFYFFPRVSTAVTTSEQGIFLSQIEAASPRVFVVSPELLAEQDISVDSMLQRWPAFHDFMARNYHLDPGQTSMDYRIYLRN